MAPLQDAVNKLCTDMLVASEFNSFKARYLMLDKDAGREAIDRMVAKLKHKAAAFQRYLVTTAGTSVGEFTESTLEGFVAAITLLTQHVATMTQTPPHMFFLRGEFPSGESIQSAEAGLVAKVEDKQVVFGEAWERVMRLAFAVQRDPRASAEDCETIWRDPRLCPEGVVVDAASKKFTMGVPLRQLLEDMGYSPQQQARILAEANPPLEATIGEARGPARPDPGPARRGARIDAVEGGAGGSGHVEGEASGVEGGAQSFPREYVEQLRKENADRRKRAEELEAATPSWWPGCSGPRWSPTAAWPTPPTCSTPPTPPACWATTAPPDPEKVKAAVTELLGRKPHYARRISGDVGQGARPGPADPNEELWGIIQSRTR